MRRRNGRALSLDQLPPDVREAVASRTAQIHGLLVRCGDHLIAIAGHVVEVERLINERRLFERWLRDELQWSYRTAKRLRQVWKRFGHPGRREALIRHFAPTALYLLAAGTCPEAVFDAACARAETGQRVTGEFVEQATRLVRRKADATTSTAPARPTMPAALSRLCHWVKQIADRADGAERELLANKLVELAEHVRCTSAAVA